MKPPSEIEVRWVVSGWDIKCPVCEGRGVVPLGFYTGPTQASTGSEECRRCGGCGTYRYGDNEAREPVTRRSLRERAERALTARHSDHRPSLADSNEYGLGYYKGFIDGHMVAAKQYEAAECVCGEINSRNCPVHS